MVNRRQPRAAVSLPSSFEIHIPQAGKIAMRVQQAQQATADTAQGGDIQLAGIGAITERFGQQRLAPREGLACVRHDHGNLAHAGAVAEKCGMGVALLFRVDQNIDAVLLKPAYRLRDMFPCQAKPERLQKHLKLRCLGWRGNQLDERDFLDRGRCGYFRQIDCKRRFCTANRVHQVDQRTVSVQCYKPW